MKPETNQARAMTDSLLKAWRAQLRKDIPRAQALLDALDREARRRRRHARQVPR